mgnify:CR=1 FL=1
MSQPMLEVTELLMQFQGLTALDRVSFSMDEGSITSLMGPNGAGKTTMFNCITGMYTPTSGQVHFRAQDITARPAYEVSRHGIARTFQNIELFEAATVLDNLLLGRNRFFQGHWWQQVLHTPALARLEEEARAEVETVIDFLDLTAWRNAPISGLPYGVRKVVELGRAICTKPELLFLDEPASGLNPEETRDLAFWIDDIRNELGITVVMVEHDMSLVSAVADRVICMAQGRILAEGTAAEVQSTPSVVSAYLGA